MCNSTCSTCCNGSCAVCNGGTTLITQPPLAGKGTALEPLKLTDGTLVNQLLQWNGTNWIAATVSGLSGQTLNLVARTLSISGGNSVTLPDDIQILSFSAPNISLSQSGGSVSLSTLLSSNTPNLMSLGTDNKFKATLNVTFPIAGNGSSASPLQFSTVGAAANQHLSWNGSAWVWTSQTITSVNGQTGAVNLAANDLSDVTVSSASAGQLLRHDGTNFVNWTPNYTVLPSAATGNMLYWNGTSWVATTPRKDVQTLSSGTTLTLPQTPLTGTIVDFYLNGLLKTEGTHYTRAGAVITVSTPFTGGDVQTTRYYS